MNKVKTYTVNCNDAWLNTDGDDTSGSYVLSHASLQFTVYVLTLFIL